MKNCLSRNHQAFLPELRAYRRRASSVVRFLLVLVAVLYGLMSQANIVSVSHNPANGAGHDSMSIVATHAGGHDHSQESPELDGGRLVHHDADHSHDTPNLTRCETPSVVKSQEVWITELQMPAYPAPCFAFERPPRFFPMS